MRYYQIYKTAKILLLMHIFSGSDRNMCFNKIKGGKQGNTGSREKGIQHKTESQENDFKKVQDWNQSKRADG